MIFAAQHSKKKIGLRRPARAVLALCIGTQAVFFPAPDAISGSNMQALEAAFLFNFAQFTHWPARKAAAEKSLVNFCIANGGIDRDSYATFEGKRIGGRVSHFEAIDLHAVSAKCDVLFIGNNVERMQLCTIAHNAAAQGTLTVSDAPDFYACGGHITLKVVNNRLRFVVNVAAAKADGFSFSSQMLDLAIIWNGL